MNEEKRRFSRIAFTYDVDIEIEGKRFRTDRILNLSVGGCLLPLEEVFEKGTECRFSLSLAGISTDINIEVFGHIQRCEEGLVAVRFARIDPDSLFHLQNIIRYNAPDADVIEEEITRHPGLK